MFKKEMSGREKRFSKFHMIFRINGLYRLFKDGQMIGTTISSIKTKQYKTHKCLRCPVLIKRGKYCPTCSEDVRVERSK